MMQGGLLACFFMQKGFISVLVGGAYQHAIMEYRGVLNVISCGGCAGRYVIMQKIGPRTPYHEEVRGSPCHYEWWCSSYVAVPRGACLHVFIQRGAPMSLLFLFYQGTRRLVVM